MEWAPRSPERGPSPARPVSPVAWGMGWTAQEDEPREVGGHFKQPGIDGGKPITSGRQTSTNRFVAPREERRYLPRRFFFRRGGSRWTHALGWVEERFRGLRGWALPQRRSLGAGGSPTRSIPSHVPVPTSGSPVCRRSPSDSSRAVSREALHVLLLLADLRPESLHPAPSANDASAFPAVAAARCLPATRATRGPAGDGVRLRVGLRPSRRVHHRGEHRRQGTRADHAQLQPGIEGRSAVDRHRHHGGPGGEWHPR